MELFSTFDVARIFQIDRTRLQEWIDQGYVRPYKKARGKGTKALFTREDLYRLRLFYWFLKTGKSRFEASVDSNINFHNVGPEEEKFKYALFVSEIAPKGALFMGRTEMLQKLPELQPRETDLMFCVVNLLAVKKEVNDLIE